MNNHPVCSQSTRTFIVDDNDMDSDTEAESDVFIVQIILAQGD